MTSQPAAKAHSRQEHVFLAAIAKGFRQGGTYTLNPNSTTFSSRTTSRVADRASHKEVRMPASLDGAPEWVGPPPTMPRSAPSSAAARLEIVIQRWIKDRLR